MYYDYNSFKMTYSNIYEHYGVFDIKQQDIIDEVIDKYIAKEGFEIDICVSSGRSVVIVPFDQEFVIQIYFNNDLFIHINEMFIDGYFDTPATVDVIDIIPEYNAIIYESIKPINTPKNIRRLCYGGKSMINEYMSMDEKNKLYKDMNENFDLITFEHGDCTIDNIGYSIKNDRYVLFDFDMSKRPKNTAKDLKIFTKSITFHGLDYKFY
jgi:hypothetical protein